MTCSTINRTTSTPFPLTLAATGITSNTCTHLHQATHQWHRGFPPEVRAIDIEMCHSIAGQCHNGTSPIILPLTNHAHQQVDVVGSFLRALSMLVVKGVGLEIRWNDEMRSDPSLLLHFQNWWNNAKLSSDVRPRNKALISKDHIPASYGRKEAVPVHVCWRNRCGGE